MGPCPQDGRGARRVLCSRPRQPEGQLYLPCHEPARLPVPAVRPLAEWACLAAIDTLALACLAAAAALPRLKWAEGILVFAAGFLLPYFFSATAAGNYAVQYVNAMADLPLAMLFGGTLCLYFAVGRHKHAYWLVALPLAVLTLTKDICFAYGLIAAFLIGLDLLLAMDAPIKKAFPKACFSRGTGRCCAGGVFKLGPLYGSCHPHGRHRCQRWQ